MSSLLFSSGEGEESKELKLLLSLVESELHYVKCLNLLKVEFRDPLAAAVHQGEPILSQEEVADIFSSSIDQLITFHAAFYDELGDKKSVSEAATMFLKRADFLKIYKSYIANVMKKGLQCYRERCQYNQNFSAFLEEKHDKLKKMRFEFTLDELLKRPTTRITEYKAFLEKCTKLDPNCSEAEAKIVAILKFVEDIPLKGEGHCEGYLSKKGVFRRSWKQRWFVLEEGVMSYYPTKPIGQDAHKTKPIGSFSVVGVPFGVISSNSQMGKKYDNCFSVVTPTRTYFLFCESKEELQKWKEMIARNGGMCDQRISSRKSSNPAQCSDSPVAELKKEVKKGRASLTAQDLLTGKETLFESYMIMRITALKYRNLDLLAGILTLACRESLAEALEKSSDQAEFWNAMFDAPPADDLLVEREDITDTKAVLSLKHEDGHEGVVTFKKEDNLWKVDTEEWNAKQKW